MLWFSRESTTIPVRKSWQGGGFEAQPLKPGTKKEAGESSEKPSESETSDSTEHIRVLHFSQWKRTYAGKIHYVKGQNKTKLAIRNWMKKEHEGSGSRITVKHKHGDLIQASGQDNLSEPDYWISCDGALLKIEPKRYWYPTVKKFMASNPSEKDIREFVQTYTLK